MNVKIAQVVFAKLPGGITHRFEELSDGRIFLMQSFRRTWQAHFQKTGTEWTLSGDKRSPSCGTAILSIGICKYLAFPNYAYINFLSHINTSKGWRLAHCFYPGVTDLGSKVKLAHF